MSVTITINEVTVVGGLCFTHCAGHTACTMILNPPANHLKKREREQGVRCLVSTAELGKWGGMT